MSLVDFVCPHVVFQASVSLESWTGTCDPKTGTCSEAVSLACFNIQLCSKLTNMFFQMGGSTANYC